MHQEVVDDLGEFSSVKVNILCKMEHQLCVGCSTLLNTNFRVNRQNVRFPSTHQ